MSQVAVLGILPIPDRHHGLGPRRSYIGNPPYYTALRFTCLGRGSPRSGSHLELIK